MKAVISYFALFLIFLAPCVAKDPKAKPTPELAKLEKPETGKLTLKGNDVIFESERGKLIFPIGTRPGLEIMPGYTTVTYEKKMEFVDGKPTGMSELTLQRISDKSFLVLREDVPVEVVQSREGGRSVWKPVKK